jgi:glycosyltransferase involved in cell wall biosynthesis
MPSRTDSFGIVFLEAWANAKPVIAAAAGGVVEVVEHERTGLLVEFGNVEQLSASIQRLSQDRNLAASLGSNGFEQLKSGCTWDDRYRTLENWMNRFIELRSNKRQTARKDPFQLKHPSTRNRARETASESL